ncbi:MAG: MFS transporter [Gallionella sp.]|nr:MFS transporter [Gallionella sp.]OIO12986.1 MAG: MFS transporter [Gallionellaceae bacterium CG1_02_60_325]PIR09916.1 MAG: MFS transporter [Gallionellaceae bacterium CG11_big_fil_rev_8_21_14_0_20_60_62]PIV48076.1 MAG: MFS transporter [Gallionellaceae bacterium CG02_land_8_20_14_3_00_60_115]PIY06235.1 MAG: MFS transporter [Gallionellaceae bacterium CG_4_10_14_3_um_filter_60_1069]PJC04778.1 MAG: MFS transporter [Gallionellaceae bacterium CG_4_9_14_0_8_um_filter_60_335]
MRHNLAADVNRREVWAWAMYDFANSGYTTIVITALFNAYFVSVVADGAPWATLVWTLSLALSYALIMLSAPLLGAYADAYAAKKRLLVITTTGCVLFTAALYFAGPGMLWLAVPLIVLSNFFFGCGENLIAAFLPELARKESLGKVSGWGWSLGYVGGLLSLGICLAYVSWAQERGDTAADFVPVTMLITAVLFALASLPTFLLLKERAQPQPHLIGKNMLQESFARLLRTMRHARHYRDLRRFLFCTVCYQAGIQTVIALAAIYAQQVMHFTLQQTLGLIFVVNITAAAGAFSFGYLQDRIGHVPAIALTLVGWIIMVLMAWASEGPGLFWAAANLAGLCMGASQSAGRALVGLLSPVARRAEFFGLWGLAVKLSSILGPVTYGLVSWLTRGDHRMAILVTGAFFLVGLLILRGVDASRGQRATLQNET